MVHLLQGTLEAITGGKEIADLPHRLRAGDAATRRTARRRARGRARLDRRRGPQGHGRDHERRSGVSGLRWWNALLTPSGIAFCEDGANIPTEYAPDRKASMRRSIGDLEQFADKRLFEELSEGMPLIIDNAARLDDTAHRLHRDGEFRASEIMRGFTEEEAAKFLILIDYVRCPRNSEHRTQVLKRFYGHVAKRIHAMACSYPRIASFEELSELVESECRPWYLDGPNGVDWIFPNSIAAEREQGLYVDYVRDITDTAGTYRWTTPDAPSPGLSQYAPPDSVTLAQALSLAGAGSAEGLAEIAHIWRQFVPEPDTDRDELQDLIVQTLDRLAHCGYAVDEPTVRLVVSHWPFPLWPLIVKEPRPPDGDLEGLRELRQRTIDWIEETEAQRDPAPAISRSKVEELNDAYAAWKRDADARPGNAAADEDTGLRIRRSADLGKV